MDKAIDQLEKIVVPSVSIAIFAKNLKLSSCREMVNQLEYSPV